jgi:putative copper resistance protein D
MGRAVRLTLGLAIGLLAFMMTGGQVALAHGGPVPELTLGTVLTSWSNDPLPWIGVVAATFGYLAAVLVVDYRHRRNPVPTWRVAAWLAGIVTIAIALESAVDVYASALFSVHMVQHMLLAMLAPPLLALGAPVTVLLRCSSPPLRRKVLLPILHSRVVAALSWPLVAWAVFSIVLLATHFSPLFDAALENRDLHNLEHLLYLGAGLLFWWPVIGADPIRWRLGRAARLAYLGAAMPVNTAIGLAIYFAPAVLYPHYVAVLRTWGPDPFTDQQIAGIVMWAVGDAAMLCALVLGIAAWLRAEETRSHRIDERTGRTVQRGSHGGG